MMKTLLGLLTLSLAVLPDHAIHAAEKSRILMVTQSQGFVHDSVKRPSDKLAAAEISMIQLGEKTELFSVDCTQDTAADFTKENLKNYDIVMFYTTGKLPIADSDMDYFLNDWLRQKGHGFIGFHSAADTYGDFQPYWDMVGGTFNGHPWNAGNTVTITVHEPDHPTMKPFGAEFTIKDEIYQYKNWQPEKVRVLMSLNMEKCSPSMPYHVPVAWVKPWGEGHVYFNNLGHNESTWTDQRFLDSITAGIKWIRGDVQGESKPNPALSEAQEALAKSVATAPSKKD
ncbi:MAG: ThuA domain-containing protein [Planctomycetaceae bacterium]|nr:ThuA domain-containing protein [Planctomycetaceae bacterium]